jgi:hypothetical protein
MVVGRVAPVLADGPLLLSSEEAAACWMGVPVESCDFLRGGEGVRVLGHVADEVDDLFDIVVAEEVVGGGHGIILSSHQLHIIMRAPSSRCADWERAPANGRCVRSRR